MASTDKEKQELLLHLATIIYEAVRDAQKAGAIGVPEGELYAHLMGHMSFNMFKGLINGLVQAEKLTNKHHLLQIVEVKHDVQVRRPNEIEARSSAPGKIA